MDISRYVQDLQNQLSVAADAAGGEAKAIADRLASTLESTARLVLLEALSEAAAEITTELAPGSVDVRLRGRDPEFVVTPPPASRFENDSTQAEPLAENPPAFDQDASETATSRLTLRLPESIKLRVETAAAREGLSVNSWLVRSIQAALTPGPAAPQTTQLRNSGNRFTGWVR